MEYAPLTKQAYQNPRTFALLDQTAQFDEQGFNVRPTKVRGCRTSKYQLQRAVVLAFH